MHTIIVTIHHQRNLWPIELRMWCPTVRHIIVVVHQRDLWSVENMGSGLGRRVLSCSLSSINGTSGPLTSESFSKVALFRRYQTVPQPRLIYQ